QEPARRERIPRLPPPAASGRPGRGRGRTRQLHQPGGALRVRAPQPSRRLQHRRQGPVGVAGGFPDPVHLMKWPFKRSNATLAESVPEGGLRRYLTTEQAPRNTPVDQIALLAIDFETT